MSVAKEAKLREWRCNIFSVNLDQDAKLFDRKKKSMTPLCDSFRSSSPSPDSYLSKKNDGDLFLYKNN